MNGSDAITAGRVWLVEPDAFEPLLVTVLGRPTYCGDSDLVSVSIEDGIATMHADHLHATLAGAEAACLENARHEEEGAMLIVRRARAAIMRLTVGGREGATLSPPVVVLDDSEADQDTQPACAGDVDGEFAAVGADSHWAGIVADPILSPQHCHTCRTPLKFCRCDTTGHLEPAGAANAGPRFHGERV
jgi:hypothetical protein